VLLFPITRTLVSDYPYRCFRLSVPLFPSISTLVSHHPYPFFRSLVPLVAIVPIYPPVFAFGRVLAHMHARGTGGLQGARARVGASAAARPSARARQGGDDRELARRAHARAVGAATQSHGGRRRDGWMDGWMDGHGNGNGDGWMGWHRRPKGAARGGVQNANAGCTGATLQRCNVATLQCCNSAPFATLHGCAVCNGASLHAWQGPVMGPVINDVQHAKIWAHIDGAPTPPPPPAPPVDYGSVAARH
jgi:hypothetical protein